jgi:hypothetical protein
MKLVLRFSMLYLLLVYVISGFFQIIKYYKPSARNFTLSLEWRIDLQTSAKEGKTGAPQGSEHQLLFVSIPDTGGWLVVGS